MNEEQWERKLLEREAWCYFKPNKRIHDSGYRCFEIGYCTLSKDGRRIKDKKILNQYCDHIWNLNFQNKEISYTPINLDVLLDGYIRVFDSHNTLWWGSFGWTNSTTYISILTERK